MVFDQLIKDGSSNEFILGSVKGINGLGGSFLVNSPVTGKWEDYAVKDVVNYIEHNYRSLANPAGRESPGFPWVDLQPLI